MEDDLKNKKMKMEDDFNFFWITRMTTLKQIRRKIMEDDLKKIKNEDNLKQKQKITKKWQPQTNQKQP